MDLKLVERRIAARAARGERNDEVAAVTVPLSRSLPGQRTARARQSGPSGLTRRELLRVAATSGAWLVASELAACAPAAVAPSPTPKATPLPPPETTSVRLHGPATCDAQFWLLADLLREEGFADVTFASEGPLTGNSEFTAAYGNLLATSVDVGLPYVALAGGHTGCIELWAAPGITSISTLKGKSMEFSDRQRTAGGTKHVGVFYGLMLSMLAYIGMDPSEMTLVDVSPETDTLANYLDGKTDAIFAAVHQGPLLRRNPRRRGQVILDTSVDKPWSQYYCCILSGRRDWVRSNPVATKRVTRAFLRASDIVAQDKKAAVQVALDRTAGVYKASRILTPEILHETIEMLSFDWRDLDPEETVRFFAQRLRDVKLVKKTPQQIVDEGTDFAYFRQLRKELRP